DIVIVSSVAGLRAQGDEAVYGATKHAQIGLAGALDRELHGEGIRVSAICPGGTATDFAMGKGRTPEDPGLAQMMRAEDVAEAIVTAGGRRRPESGDHPPDGARPPPPRADPRNVRPLSIMVAQSPPGEGSISVSLLTRADVSAHTGLSRGTDLCPVLR